MSVSIMIVDDHAIIREGLKMIFESQGDMIITCMAADGRDAISKAESIRPQVIVMDIAMPGLNGIEATRIIREKLPSVKVVILSMHNNLEHIFRAMQAGAHGYILKESAGSEIVKAVRAVMKGHRYFGKGVEVPPEKRNPDNTGHCKSPLDSLSPRELEVLQLVAEGKTSVEIAKTLSLSPKSVETYRSRLMLKLGIGNIPALVKFALQHGITPTN